MKKYFLVVGVIGLVVTSLVYVFEAHDKTIIDMQPNEAISIDIYNAASPFSKDSEVQRMRIDGQQGVADVVNHVNKIKPNKSAKALDGNYTIVFNKTDGSKLRYVYMNGIVKTSTGFNGSVSSDNMMNRLWASLTYPVQNVQGDELPSIE